MKNYLKFYFKSVLYLSVGYALALVLIFVLILGEDMGILRILDASVSFGLIWSLVAVVYNYKALKTKGVSEFSVEDLGQKLRFEKESAVAVNALAEKIDNVKNHDNYKLIRTENGLILKSKLFMFEDDIVINSSEIDEGRYLYYVHIDQKDKYHLEDYKKNMDYLHWIKHYL